MDRTLIFLLDRSGSMETCRADTIGGFNAFVSDQKTLGGKLTLVQFDHEIKNVYEDVHLDQVNPLSPETFPKVVGDETPTPPRSVASDTMPFDVTAFKRDQVGAA
jgi:hypothetical protein